MLSIKGSDYVSLTDKDRAELEKYKDPFFGKCDCTFKCCDCQSQDTLKEGGLLLAVLTTGIVVYLIVKYL